MTVGISIAAIVITILIMIGILIWVYISYKKKTGLFKPYTPASVPSGIFYPLGGVTELTPAQQAARKEALTRAPPSS